MGYARRFQGRLCGKNVYDYTKKLDYSIKDLDNRVYLLKEILKDDDYFIEYFNPERKPKPHFNIFPVNDSSCNDPNSVLSEEDTVCKCLEQMADYMLMCKENIEMNKKRDKKILTNRDENNIRKKESVLSDILPKNMDSDDEMVESDFIDNIIINTNNYKKAIKQKITKNDLKNDYIKAYQTFMDWLIYKLNHDNLTLYQRLKIRKQLSFLRDDQILTKDKLYGTIYPKSVLPDTTVFNFDSDTGYYNEDDNYIHVSENRIDLTNPLHIYELLEHYVQLREQHWEDVQSDMRYILDTLEWLIKESNLRDFEMDIIVWKIDGFSGIDICEKLKLKYGLDWSEEYVSIVYKQQIPHKIANTYKETYEEWFYTFKAKGDYKTCSRCVENKLRNDKYFGKHPQTKDGFYPSCKVCRSK